MSIGILEYTAGGKLEMLAHELRENMGANQFYSLLSALFSVAGSEEIEQLRHIFPVEFQERTLRYHASAGLIKPGEHIRIGDWICEMGDDHKITYTEVKDEETESES